MPAPSRVLVTGARGFLGRQVSAELLRRFAGAEIVAVSRRPASADDHPGPTLDLSQAAAWRELGGYFDWMLHLAARVPSFQATATDDALYLANVLPSLHLIDATQSWRPSRLIYVSSISVYPMGAAPVLHEGLVPRPDTFYGAAKLAGEHLAALTAASGAGVVVLRLSSLYGPGQAAGTVLPLFIANAAAGKSAWVRELWTKKTGYKAVAIVDASATGRLAIRRASRKTLYKAKAATSSMAIRATAGFHPLSESHRAR